MLRPEHAVVTKPFVAVTAATLVFFVYVGIMLADRPAVHRDELDAGESASG